MKVEILHALAVIVTAKENSAEVSAFKGVFSTLKMACIQYMSNSVYLQAWRI